MPAAAVTVVRTRGVPRRFPFLQQIDGLDCGPTCLEMIGRYYGRNYSRQYIRQLCQLDRQGASFATLGRAAERLGFRTLGVRLSFEDLRDKALLPCIAFWGSAHFVVIYRISGDRVSVADPSAGLLTWTREEFESSWLAETGGNGSGFVLLLERTGELVPDTMPEDQRPTSRYLWEPLRMDLRPRLLPIASAAILSLVIQFAAPFLAATLVDSGVSRGDLSFIHVVLIAQFVFFLSKLGIDTLQASLVAYIGLRLDIRLTAAFIAKLTRLPLSFFDSKRIGDLFQRIADHQRIQQFLTDGLSTLLLALLSLAVFGAVLAVFRPMLFFIFAAGSGLYLVYCAIFFRRQRILNYKNFQLAARNQGLIIELLSGMQEIKLNNAEQQRRWQWEAAQNGVFRNQLKTVLTAQVQGGGGAALNEIKNLLITLIVAHDVVTGRISLGTMVAVQAIVAQLSWPLNQIATLLCRSQDALLSNARLREIHSLADEADLTSRASPGEPSDLHLRNVSFDYGGTTARFVLQNINLLIPRGKTTAIVGRSGSGKTTLLRLLLKFYPPTEGRIVLGDSDLAELSHYEWRNACGVVMQDGYIFSDTILRNIAVADDDVNRERVVEVARIAQIHSFIENLALGYDTRIGREGIGISRGQAQRILIARALYKDPQYMFLDEATSALDAETESAIVKSLRSQVRGKTAVIIAHRMSTVRNADQIVVLDGGEVVETGDHAELVANRGKYFELVRNQLELEA